MQTPNELLPDGLQMDLLWTNASLTSAFATQRIDLDLSNYKFVYITFCFIDSINDKTISYLLKIGSEVRVSMLGYASIYYRPIGVRDNSIAFGSGLEIYSYNDSAVKADIGCMPYQIYGVR